MWTIFVENPRNKLFTNAKKLTKSLSLYDKIITEQKKCPVIFLYLSINFSKFWKR